MVVSINTQENRNACPQLKIFFTFCFIFLHFVLTINTLNQPKDSLVHLKIKTQDNRKCMPIDYK